MSVKIENRLFRPVIDNPILATDAYKLTHWLQYPKDTQVVYSYLESRGGEFDHTVFFGLQYFLKQYLTGRVITYQDVDRAEIFTQDLFGHNKYFNREGWIHIINKYDGRLPVRICAVPEGTRVPVHNVLMTMENTDENCPWLTNFLESLLLKVWYPTTVCTLSNEIKRLIGKYAKQTGGSVHPFHLNDFGDRGVSSPESAALGGAAHLVNFQGTDTLQAIQMLRALYNGGKDTGHSVMASEHSTTTIYGKDAEEDAYRHFLQVAEPNSILSVVIDSWDTLNAVNYILGEKLKKEILERPGRLVLRPDSGTPEEMAVQVTDLAFNRFGGTTNAAGYKELNPKIGVIYGDGITYRSIGMILENMVKHKYAVSNLVFGMGGGLLQQVNRDTQKFAFKCSWAKVADEGREVFKQPKTDSGKNSKKGRLKLCQTNFGQLATFQEDFQADTLQSENLLVPVFENGELLVDQSLNDIRQRAAQ